jgi:hypothetical protein
MGGLESQAEFLGQGVIVRCGRTENLEREFFENESGNCRVFTVAKERRKNFAPTLKPVFDFYAFLFVSMRIKDCK